jgi:hypothetical protein
VFSIDQKALNYAVSAELKATDAAARPTVQSMSLAAKDATARPRASETSHYAASTFAASNRDRESLQFTAQWNTCITCCTRPRQRLLSLPNFVTAARRFFRVWHTCSRRRQMQGRFHAASIGTVSRPSERAGYLPYPAYGKTLRSKA